MNFFAHAVVSMHLSPKGEAPSPRVTLGSMLPDFATMAGVRLARSKTEAKDPVFRGIALHHRTDAVFHGVPSFIELLHWAGSELEGREYGRGPCAAVAHVGVELALDGALAADPSTHTVYVDALKETLPDDLALRTGSLSALSALQHRLRKWGVPADYADSDVAADRMRRVLQSRPRLALNTREIEALPDFFALLSDRVTRAAPRLLAETLDGLERKAGFKAASGIVSQTNGGKNA